MRLDFRDSGTRSTTQSDDAHPVDSTAPVPEPSANNGECPDKRVIPAAEMFAQKASQMPDWDELLKEAQTLEDADRVPDAIEMYRVALVAGGPRAEVCFRLAELLYRAGDLGAARERYSMAIELDEDYVEARANLACVLTETGETELAVAAFQGALESHPDYPDVHYHLARLLDDQNQPEQAEFHWHRFLELSPNSPWADEARSHVAGDADPVLRTHDSDPVT